MIKDLRKTVFGGVAMAMGVAIIVINIVSQLSVTEATSMLGIGVAALGLANLQESR